MQQWEYKIVKVNASNGALSMYGQASYKEFRPTAGGVWEDGSVDGATATIDTLGANGWELVSINPQTDPPSLGELVAVFKRPKQA
jgi:hypothetical protein